jgi:hypothetical protein
MNNLLRVLTALRTVANILFLAASLLIAVASAVSA